MRWQVFVLIRPFPQYRMGILHREGEINELMERVKSMRNAQSSSMAGGQIAQRLRLFHRNSYELNQLIEQSLSNFEHKPLGAPLALQLQFSLRIRTSTGDREKFL